MTTTNPTNYGPLTTTFTPSPNCFTETWIYHNDPQFAELSWGVACTPSSSGVLLFSNAPSCFPEGYVNIMNSYPNNPGTINQVFSPAYVCPYGWTVAASSTWGTPNGKANYQLGMNFVTMDVDDILSVCCPRYVQYFQMPIGQLTYYLCVPVVTSRATMGVESHAGYD